MSFDLFDGEGVEFEHLQRLQAAGQRQEMQEQLSSIEKELAEQQQEARRRKRLPKCPACGVRLEGQYRKCHNCKADLVWISGLPCEPADVPRVKKQLAERHKKAELRRSHENARETMRQWFREGKRSARTMAAVLKSQGFVRVSGQTWTEVEVEEELEDYLLETREKKLGRLHDFGLWAAGLCCAGCFLFLLAGPMTETVPIAIGGLGAGCLLFLILPALVTAAVGDWLRRRCSRERARKRSSRQHRTPRT